MSILLYGVIASNGLKVLIESRVDFGQVRNLIIASSMLVLGLGGAVLNIGAITLSGTALSPLSASSSTSSCQRQKRLSKCDIQAESQLRLAF